jgi:hypothetical protein
MIIVEGHQQPLLLMTTTVHDWMAHAALTAMVTDRPSFWA